MVSLLIKGNLSTQTHTQRRLSYGDSGNTGEYHETPEADFRSDTVANLETQRAASNYQKLARGEEWLFPKVFRGSVDLCILLLEFWGSRTMRK